MRIRKKHISILFIFLVLLIAGAVVYMRHSDYLYFGKALTYGKWINYEDRSLGAAYSYPDGIGWNVSQKGWTAIFSCPTPISIVGDSNQIYALSICKNPSKESVELLLKDERYIKDNLNIAGKNYVVLSTKVEKENGIKTGRYLIAEDNSYLFGIARPYGIETAVDKIFIRIIESIRNI